MSLFNLENYSFYSSDLNKPNTVQSNHQPTITDNSSHHSTMSRSTDRQNYESIPQNLQSNILAAEEGRSNLVDSNSQLNELADQSPYGGKAPRTLRSLFPTFTKNTRYQGESEPLIGGNNPNAEDDGWLPSIPSIPSIIGKLLPKFTVPAPILDFFTKHKYFFYFVAIISSITVAIILLFTGNNSAFSTYVKAILCYYLGNQSYMGNYCDGEVTAPTPSAGTSSVSSTYTSSTSLTTGSTTPKPSTSTSTSTTTTKATTTHTGLLPSDWPAYNY